MGMGTYVRVIKEVVCGRCGKTHQATRSDSLCRRCKQDKSRAWKKRNPQAVKAWKAAHYQKYKDMCDARNAKWDSLNTDRLREIKRASQARNPETGTAAQAKRRALQCMATPLWASDFIIKEAYRLARLRTKMLGFKWHVDHIVPLRSKLVCGLHVEHNLQVIPAETNISKSNKFWPDMPT